MAVLRTKRLELIPLTAEQLELYLSDPPALETVLRVPVSRAILTEPVQRAIRAKLELLLSLDPELHPWLTYWLVVVTAASFGAGLIGFQGEPDVFGQVEVGYGIDPAYGRKGYTTEAVQRLIAWAFGDPACKAVLARNIDPANWASLRVAAKAGMVAYEESETGISLRIDRAPSRS